ncbi:hypothetical protein GBF38_019368 [Nibea albiflora]|uniref:Uncharacterized protein n=1 Tax=Nibea albiflora TaxID=240163 RepID=A0ACB7F198_NIBAL|nr:hypothetical protein GBF38_019368 [Nibea albiflora]
MSSGCSTSTQLILAQFVSPAARTVSSEQHRSVSVCATGKRRFSGLGHWGMLMGSGVGVEPTELKLDKRAMLPGLAASMDMKSEANRRLTEEAMERNGESDRTRQE